MMRPPWRPDGAETDDTAPLVLINTTPLVDVMLVLLIIFLITVPVVSAGGPVRLPRETARPVEPVPGAAAITVTADGEVWWGETLLADETALDARLAAVAALSPPPPVHLHADGETRHQAVARVLARIRAAGLTRVGFVTEPETAR